MIIIDRLYRSLLACPVSKVHDGVYAAPNQQLRPNGMGQQDTEERDKGRQRQGKSQDKTRQDKTRQDKTRQDKTRQDETRQDKTRQDKTRQDKKRQVKTRQDKTRQDKTRQNNQKRQAQRQDPSHDRAISQDKSITQRPEDIARQITRQKTKITRGYRKTNHKIKPNHKTITRQDKSDDKKTDSQNTITKTKDTTIGLARRPSPHQDDHHHIKTAKTIL